MAVVRGARCVQAFARREDFLAHASSTKMETDKQEIFRADSILSIEAVKSGQDEILLQIEELKVANRTQRSAESTRQRALQLATDSDRIIAWLQNAHNNHPQPQVSLRVRVPSLRQALKRTTGNRLREFLQCVSQGNVDQGYQ